jgi:hypothetical protein
MLQWFLQSRLQTTFREFYGPYNDLGCQYKLPFGKILSKLLGRSWYTEVDCILFRLPYVEKRLTAGDKCTII